MEIYMERIRDLLARKVIIHFITIFDLYWLSLAQNDNLQVHEDKVRGVYVKNLSDYYVGDAKEVYEIMRQGGLARAVSSTS